VPLLQVFFLKYDDVFDVVDRPIAATLSADAGAAAEEDPPPVLLPTVTAEEAVRWVSYNTQRQRECVCVCVTA
jgi:hypothetical protein